MITESFEDATLNVLIKKQHYLNLINKVKDVNGAVSVCNELNIDISDIVFEKSDSLSVRAFKELSIIIKALNEGWKPNWNDTSQYKYYNWFNMNAGTFSYADTLCDTTYAHVPSALFFKSCELAEYAGRTFINLYKDLMIF